MPLPFKPIMHNRIIPFYRPPHLAGEEAAVAAVLASGALVGGGAVTRSAQAMLEAATGSPKVLLTASGTAALEMACLLLDLQPGDEVVLPSFTFSSCANAIALRGAVPVFVDIRPDTLNIDEDLIEAALTPRTHAIMPVHYAGIAAEMGEILTIGRRHGLAIIEDAAQGVGARYRGSPLGTIGRLGAYSFHGSKNISCGEGGALMVNDPALIERAEIIWEKGTNRSQFMRGQVDKYTWLDIGSSFLMSELSAALLVCQLEQIDTITTQRRAMWERYHNALAPLEREGLLRRPHVPPDCEPNGHIYYIFMPTAHARDAALAGLQARGIHAVFHYVPLHSSLAGRRLGRAHGGMQTTIDLSSRLLRLPLYVDMSPADQDYVVANLDHICREYFKSL